VDSTAYSKLYTLQGILCSRNCDGESEVKGINWKEIPSSAASEEEYCDIKLKKIRCFMDFSIQNTLNIFKQNLVRAVNMLPWI
jgi:hypothetical protein